MASSLSSSIDKVASLITSMILCMDFLKIGQNQNIIVAHLKGLKFSFKCARIEMAPILRMPFPWSFKPDLYNLREEI